MNLIYTNKVIAFNNSLRRHYAIKSNPMLQIAWNAMLLSLFTFPITATVCGLFSLLTGVGLPILPFVILALAAIPVLFAAIAFSKQIATGCLQVATLLIATPVAFALDSVITLASKLGNALYAMVSSKRNITAIQPLTNTSDIKRREIKLPQDDNIISNVFTKQTKAFFLAKKRVNNDKVKVSSHLSKDNTAEKADFTYNNN